MRDIAQTYDQVLLLILNIVKYHIRVKKLFCKFCGLLCSIKQGNCIEYSKSIIDGIRVADTGFTYDKLRSDKFKPISSITPPFACRLLVASNDNAT